VFTHELETKHDLESCDLNFIIEREGLLNVKHSHIHYLSGNISEMVLERDITAGSDLGVSNNSNCNNLECT